MKRFLKIFLCSIILILLIMSCNTNYTEIFSLPDDFIVSYEDIKEINSSKKFGGVIDVKLEQNTKGVANVKEDEGVIIFKLFGFIPIRKVVVKMLPDEEVYLGGIPIGVSMTIKGLVFIEDNENCLSKNQLKKGDLIYKINGKEIVNFEDVNEVLENSQNEVEVEFLRKNKIKTAKIKPYKDGEKCKLGLITKDDVSGVGTLTYVNQKGEFGALGHSINEDGNLVNPLNGNIYNCSQIGIEKGKINEPGQLKCVFVNDDKKGEISENLRTGLYGKITDKKGVIDENMTAKLGGRLSVSPGKAKIVSSVSGIREEYEIEIIKANYQKKTDDKSMVFRVTDKRLLDLTGGIIQGMSGSPIIQNNKIVGAVTHVFVNDPTKGYGIYIDWMIC